MLISFPEYCGVFFGISNIFKDSKYARCFGMDSASPKEQVFGLRVMSLKMDVFT